MQLRVGGESQKRFVHTLRASRTDEMKFACSRGWAVDLILRSLILRVIVIAASGKRDPSGKIRMRFDSFGEDEVLFACHLLRTNERGSAKAELLISLRFLKQARWIEGG